MTTTHAKYLILLLYLIWFVDFILSISGSYSYIAFTYLTFFQMFIPGFVLGISFGLSKRPLTEIILYSFVFSYFVYLIVALPTLFFNIDWEFFLTLNFLLYFFIAAIFLLRINRGLLLEWDRPNINEVFVIILAVAVAISFTYINFRSDASQYNNRIASSLQSEQVQTVHSTQWTIDDNGELSSESKSIFHHDYKPYFSFLALPLKYFYVDQHSYVDQRYGWFIFSKFFILLSIVAAYCLGNRLYGVRFAHISLLCYIFIVFVLGFYAGSTNLKASGIFFSQIAYPRGVSFIFLLAFYITSLDAIRTRETWKFFAAGLILLCIFTISSMDFYWASLNFLLFSIIVFLKSGFSKKDLFYRIIQFLKHNAYVAIPSAIVLLAPFSLTDYWREGLNFRLTWVDRYPDFDDPRYKLNTIEWAKKFIDRSGILYVTTLILSFPLLIKLVIKERNISTQFLLSNISALVIFKSPMAHNFLVDNKLRMISLRIDHWFLFFIFIAFLVNLYVSKRTVNNEDSSKKSIWLYCSLIVIISIAFGTDNRFSKDLRHRKNAGYEFLESTEYLRYLKPISDKTEGISVLTNIKTAVDVYAFINAATFQYRSDYYWSLSIALGRKDLEHLLFYPNDVSHFVEGYKKWKDLSEFLNAKSLNNQFLRWKDKGGRLIDLIELNRVDYIVIPTLNSPYSSKVESSIHFNNAIDFYNNLDNYTLVYLDRYYYVYKRKD